MTQQPTVLTIESLAECVSFPLQPCLSLYQSTSRFRPGNRQDPIRFRNLVGDLETSLRQEYPAIEAQPLLEPFEALAQDSAFWEHTLDGLAVLGGPSLFRVFTLQGPVAELAVAADTFHTTPLRRLLQGVGRYQVLGLSLHRIQLFEGSGDALDPIALAPGVPRTIKESLGGESATPHPTVAPDGSITPAVTPMQHGHSEQRDDAPVDAERFFRAIDRAVLERHSRPSGLPLILAALPQHHHLFHQVSHNPFLLAEGLATNPDVLTIGELRERAWQVVEPQYLARLAAAADEFTAARSKGLGSDDLAEVAQAAAAGRVGMLMIESDRRIAGRLDGATGRVEVVDPSHPHVDDLLDDLGDLVGKMGGQVMVMAAEWMPGGTGLAATYRY